MVTHYFIAGETLISPVLSQVNKYGRSSRLTSLVHLSSFSHSSAGVNTNTEAGNSQLIHHSSCQTQLTLPCHEEEVLAGDEWRAYDFGGTVRVCERG